MINSQNKLFSLTTDRTYQKGQSIFYKGDEAQVLEIKPVFTIKLKGKSHVVCGNALLKDVCLNISDDHDILFLENS
jgi:hypothetical protein